MQSTGLVVQRDDGGSVRLAAQALGLGFDLGDFGHQLALGNLLLPLLFLRLRLLACLALLVRLVRVRLAGDLADAGNDLLALGNVGQFDGLFQHRNADGRVAGLLRKLAAELDQLVGQRLPDRDAVVLLVDDEIRLLRRDVAFRVAIVDANEIRLA